MYVCGIFGAEGLSSSTAKKYLAPVRFTLISEGWPDQQ